MILTNEDYEGLTKAIALLQRICKNAVMSELEEEQERRQQKQLENLGYEKVFEVILLKRRKQIPKMYREIIDSEWLKKHTRLRNNGTYEIRCSINRVNVTGSGKSLELAAENFIKSLMNAGKASKKPKEPEKKRVLFNDFAEEWLELFKKPTVKEITYNTMVLNFKAHIKPYFKKDFLDEITAMRIQPLFNKFVEMGKPKVTVTLKYILKQVFDGAVAEHLIAYSPMNGVKVLKHHSKNGSALTYDEESEFLSKLATSRFRLTYSIMLFGGMRRAELASIRIKGGFIIVKDGKRRRSQLETERKVPITPMLQRVLSSATGEEIKTACSYSCDMLSREFKKLCPNHHLHELRHTFITRCQECGVSREVVSVWAGHAADNTMTSTVYTHFSPEFMLAEGKKVDYYNRLSD